MLPSSLLILYSADQLALRTSNAGTSQKYDLSSDCVVCIQQGRFPSPEKIHLDQEAVLYIDHAEVKVQALQLKGALQVEGHKDAKIAINHLDVNNKGWEWRAIDDEANAQEAQKIRYFNLSFSFQEHCQGSF